MRFKPGDKVEIVNYGGKRIGDGVILSGFKTLCGDEQYVVEQERGVLSFYKLTSLRSRERYHVGDQVVKAGGDYRFEGVVVAVFTKLSGAERYVVEDARGILHIFSADNLRRQVGGPEPSKEDSQ